MKGNISIADLKPGEDIWLTVAVTFMVGEPEIWVVRTASFIFPSPGLCHADGIRRVPARARRRGRQVKTLP